MTFPIEPRDIPELRVDFPATPAIDFDDDAYWYVATGDGEKVAMFLCEEDAVMFEQLLKAAKSWHEETGHGHPGAAMYGRCDWICEAAGLKVKAGKRG